MRSSPHEGAGACVPEIVTIPLGWTSRTSGFWRTARSAAASRRAAYPRNVASYRARSLPPCAETSATAPLRSERAPSRRMTMYSLGTSWVVMSPLTLMKGARRAGPAGAPASAHAPAAIDSSSSEVQDLLFTGPPRTVARVHCRGFPLPRAAGRQHALTIQCSQRPQHSRTSGANRTASRNVRQLGQLLGRARVSVACGSAGRLTRDKVRHARHLSAPTRTGALRLDVARTRHHGVTQVTSSPRATFGVAGRWFAETRGARRERRAAPDPRYLPGTPARLDCSNGLSSGAACNQACDRPGADDVSRFLAYRCQQIATGARERKWEVVIKNS